MRACSLVRSSLPYVSGSSVHHKGPSYRGTFSRSVTLLTNSKLLARTFAITTGSGSSSGVGLGTVDILSRVTKVGNVLNNRMVSLSFIGGPPSVSTLYSVCTLGANYLLHTTTVVNTCSTNTSMDSMGGTSLCTRGINLTFRVVSSVLSRATSTTLLNGPINDSRGGSGAAFIALLNLSNTGGTTVGLASRTGRVVGDFDKSARGVEVLAGCLLGEGFWEAYWQ